MIAMTGENVESTRVAVNVLLLPKTQLVVPVEN